MFEYISHLGYDKNNEGKAGGCLCVPLQFELFGNFPFRNLYCTNTGL